MTDDPTMFPKQTTDPREVKRARMRDMAKLRAFLAKPHVAYIRDVLILSSIPLGYVVVIWAHKTFG